LCGTPSRNTLIPYELDPRQWPPFPRAPTHNSCVLPPKPSFLHSPEAGSPFNVCDPSCSRFFFFFLVFFFNLVVRGREAFFVAFFSFYLRERLAVAPTGVFPFSFLPYFLVNLSHPNRLFFFFPPPPPRIFFFTP